MTANLNKLSQSDRDFIARTVFSVIVLGAALFVILVGTYPDPTLKWAFGIVGLIIGWWLR